MKKILFAIILYPSLLAAQSYFPSYPKVVTEFLKRYSFTPAEPVDGITFAKKKDGWHVHLKDQMTEHVKSDQLFWSAQNKNFLSLSGFDEPVLDYELENAVTGFLERSGSFNMLPYERCAYFGYNEWPEDMVRDFGSGDKQSYSDTLLEGLGRAYSWYASKFLWYQMGTISTDDDSLKRKLTPLELPSDRRIDSVNHYIGKAIETYQILADKYKTYMTLVGNSRMKLFNEQLNGYMQMMMSGHDSLAHKYLGIVQPNEILRSIAHNNLGNCAPNAILFTFGDNDTYPLWYIQQVENFRKDVAVININLLGLAMYVDMLKRNQLVKFSTSSECYGERGFVYFLKKGENGGAVDIAEFIKAIQNKTYPDESEWYGTMARYTNDEIKLSVDLARFRKLVNQPNFSPTLKIKLPDYITSDQFLILDIINSNLYNRPVYFSSQHELFTNYLQKQGLIYQFLPLDTTKTALNDKISVAKTKEYLVKKYKPTPSNDFSSGLVAEQNQDAIAYATFCYVAKYYLEKNKQDSAYYFTNALLKAYNNNLPFTTNLIDVAALLFDTGHEKDGDKLLNQQIEKMYQLYRSPSAYYPYMARKTVLNTAINAQVIFQIKQMEAKRIDEIVSLLNKEDY